MDRRGFLRTLGIATGLAVAAPRLIVSTPTTSIAEPARTLFLPPAGGWLPAPVRRPTPLPQYTMLPSGEVADFVLVPPPTVTANLEGFYDPDLDALMMRQFAENQPVQYSNLTLPSGQIVRGRLDSYTVDSSVGRGTRFKAGFTIVDTVETMGGNWKESPFMLDGKPYDQKWAVNVDYPQERRTVTRLSGDLFAKSVFVGTPDDSDI
jgi:hypothetical protein